VGAAALWVAAWAWAIVAGGGGLLLLIERGPLPLTNGWFALFSGISACPLTAWLVRKFAGVAVSGRVRLAAAVVFLIAGRIALFLETVDDPRPRQGAQPLDSSIRKTSVSP
jgi:hypothetical protein